MSDPTGNGGSTASMWLRMLGLGPMMDAATSPAFQQQIAQLVAAILETRIRVERIEFKLDALLDKLDPDGSINRRHIPAPLAILPDGGATAGNAGGDGAASVAVDARGSEPAHAAEPAGGSVDGAGPGYFAPGWRPY